MCAYQDGANPGYCQQLLQRKVKNGRKAGALAGDISSSSGELPLCSAPDAKHKKAIFVIRFMKTCYLAL